MNCLDIIESILDLEHEIATFHSDARPSLEEFLEEARGYYPVTDSQLRSLQKNLKLPRYRHAREVIGEIHGLWNNQHPLMFPGVSETELRRLLSDPLRLLACASLGAMTEDLIRLAAERYQAPPGALPELSRSERMAKVGQLSERRAELMLELTEAAKREVAEDHRGVECVAWTIPPREPQHPRRDPGNGVIDPGHFETVDKDQDALRRYNATWRGCDPVTLLPESTLASRLLAWHQQWYPLLEAEQKPSGQGEFFPTQKREKMNESGLGRTFDRASSMRRVLI